MAPTSRYMSAPAIRSDRMGFEEWIRACRAMPGGAIRRCLGGSAHRLARETDGLFAGAHGIAASAPAVRPLTRGGCF